MQFFVAKFNSEDTKARRLLSEIRNSKQIRNVNLIGQGYSALMTQRTTRLSLLLFFAFG